MLRSTPPLRTRAGLTIAALLALTTAASAQEQPRSAPHLPCPSIGDTPEAYGAEAVAPEGRIELGGAGWRMLISDRHAPPSFKDARDVSLPGWVPLPPRDGDLEEETTVWLERRFEAPAELGALDTLALDLGGRYGRTQVWLNGEALKGDRARNAPWYRAGGLPLKPGENVVRLRVTFTGFIGGLRWYGAAHLGRPARRSRGWVTRTFISQLDDAQHTMAVHVPRCADLTRPLPVVIALPGWGGNIWSFAGMHLSEQTAARSWLLVVPDPRGNRYYTDDSEQGVLESLDLIARELPIDPDRVYLTGFSMGGAGALHIGHHYPDRFAAVAAFHGFSELTLDKRFWKRILRNERRAAQYSSVEFVGNARHLPVMLVHARDDSYSPFAQSLRLVNQRRRADLDPPLLIAPDEGNHTLGLIDAHTLAVLDLFERSRRVRQPQRVSFRTNHGRYPGAWWLRVELNRDGRFGEADLEYRDDALIVHRLTKGVERAVIDLHKLGWDPTARPLRLDVRAQTLARLVLDGTPPGRSVRLLGEDDGSLVELELDGGAAIIPPLQAGRYTVSLGL